MLVGDCKILPTGIGTWSFLFALELLHTFAIANLSKA